MKITSVKTVNRDRKRKKIRAVISGTAEKPRLSVFKSNTAISAQIIDDERGVTLAAASSKEVKGKKGGKELAREVGSLIAKRAAEKKVSKIVFDRGGYIYTGQVEALAEGAREGGLNF